MVIVFYPQQKARALRKDGPYETSPDDQRGESCGRAAHVASDQARNHILAGQAGREEAAASSLVHPAHMVRKVKCLPFFYLLVPLPHAGAWTIHSTTQGASLQGRP